nr:pectinesterase, active site-containing protein [Tanacetum cinerariifolium]
MEKNEYCLDCPAEFPDRESLNDHIKNIHYEIARISDEVDLACSVTVKDENAELQSSTPIPTVKDEVNLACSVNVKDENAELQSSTPIPTSHFLFLFSLWKSLETVKDEVDLACSMNVKDENAELQSFTPIPTVKDEVDLACSVNIKDENAELQSSTPIPEEPVVEEAPVEGEDMYPIENVPEGDYLGQLLVRMRGLIYEIVWNEFFHHFGPDRNNIEAHGVFLERDRILQLELIETIVPPKIIHSTVVLPLDGIGNYTNISNRSTGPDKHLEVALRVRSFYDCRFILHQHTLCAHSLSQLYRKCGIHGTVDFIFGNALAILERCLILVRKPIPGANEWLKLTDLPLCSGLYAKRLCKRLYTGILTSQHLCPSVGL